MPELEKSFQTELTPIRERRHGKCAEGKGREVDRPHHLSPSRGNSRSPKMDDVRSRGRLSLGQRVSADRVCRMSVSDSQSRLVSCIVVRAPSLSSRSGLIFNVARLQMVHMFFRIKIVLGNNSHITWRYLSRSVLFGQQGSHTPISLTKSRPP